MKSQQIPSTPTNMLKEHRKTTYEAIEMIRKGEKLYIEVVESIFMTWELLLEDEAVEKIKEDARQAELRIAMVKADMKKFSLKEKVAKVVELKQLQ